MFTHILNTPLKLQNLPMWRENFGKCTMFCSKHQDALDDEDLARYALALDLDADRVIAEVLDGAHAKRIREDFVGGVKSGLNGTPTFFINGVRYDGPRDAETMIEALTSSSDL